MNKTGGIALIISSSGLSMLCFYQKKFNGVCFYRRFAIGYHTAKIIPYQLANTDENQAYSFKISISDSFYFIERYIFFRNISLDYLLVSVLCFSANLINFE